MEEQVEDNNVEIQTNNTRQVDVGFLQAVIALVDIATQRGAIKGEELIQVGLIRQTAANLLA